MFLVCIAHVTPAIMVMRGLTFQPWALIAFIRRLYLSSFVWLAWLMNLSCVKVNSMIWISRYYVRIRGPFCSNGAVCIYTMSSSNLWGIHILWCCMCNSISRVSWYCLVGLLCCLLAFVSVGCLVRTLGYDKLVSWWDMALWNAIVRPLRIMLLQRESNCCQVSLSSFFQSVQLGLVYICG